MVVLWLIKNVNSQSHFGIRLVWLLIEAIHLRVGLADKTAAKNTTRSETKVWRFFKAALAWSWLPKGGKFASSKGQMNIKQQEKGRCKRAEGMELFPLLWSLKQNLHPGYRCRAQ